MRGETHQESAILYRDNTNVNTNHSHLHLKNMIGSMLPTQ